MKDRFTQKKEVRKVNLGGQDPADIIAEKQHKKQVLELENTEGGGVEDKHRVSLNLPKEKYEIIKKKAKAQGLTLTAYIIILINQDIENA